MVKALEQATIEYTFTGEDSARAGYAEGEVTMTAPDGVYHLYWADKTAALSGWYEIASVTVTGGRGSYRFGERVAVPAGADRLIAVAGGCPATVAQAAAVCVLPAYKRFPGDDSTRQYRCEVLSDIHIDCQDGGTNTYYTAASDNLLRALNIAQERGADFVLTVGDNITNASGATLEWLEYQRVVAASDYDGPVYEAIGNHEMRYCQYSDCELDCGIEEFISATGLDGTAAAMEMRKPYFELTEPVSGDHFIFMALEGGYDPAECEEFTDDQITWLEDLLRRYSGDGHRIFLLQHSLISGYGAGDDRDDPAYGGSMTATAAYPNNLRFKKLIEQYKDVIWLSGHTHVDLRDDVNFSDEEGETCLTFHVPSSAGTTRLSYDDDGARVLDRTFYDDATQGYILDAYAGAALMCGVNFYDNKMYPAYTYIIGDTAEGEGPTAPTDAPTSPPTEKPTAASLLYGDADGDGEVSILDATVIQRDLVGFEKITGECLKAAMVDGTDTLNIIDATLIQRRLVGLLDRFPAEESLAATGAADISAAVKAELEAYYQYASYTEYAALKRALRAGDSAAMQRALSAFRTLRGRVKLTTVYFTDSKSIGHVYAYAWNRASNEYIEPWPGQKTTYVRTNSLGQQVYAVTVDAARYDSIVFSLPGEDRKTADIRLAPQSGRVYYPVSDTSPYTVSFSVMNQMWKSEDGASATVYFTDTQDWGKAYLYYWTASGNNTWPGVKMTYVRKSSSGKSIYKATVPADAKVIFSDGDSRQTADIPAVADGFGYYPYALNDDGKWQFVEYKY